MSSDFILTALLLDCGRLLFEVLLQFSHHSRVFFKILLSCLNALTVIFDPLLAQFDLGVHFADGMLQLILSILDLV